MTVMKLCAFLSFYSLSLALDGVDVALFFSPLSTHHIATPSVRVLYRTVPVLQTKDK